MTGSSARDGRAIVVSVPKCSQKAPGSSAVSASGRVGASVAELFAFIATARSGPGRVGSEPAASLIHRGCDCTLEGAWCRTPIPPSPSSVWSRGRPNTDETVYLFDVDNTLLDNDHVAADLRQHLTEEFGAERQQRYWDEFERLRQELGYADYLGALQRFRLAFPHDTHLLGMSDWLIDYPFADRLYPGVLELIEAVHLRGRR
jgi:hypothetical protein